MCGPFLFQRRLLSSSFFSSSTCFLGEILLSLMLTLSRSVLFSLVVVVWLPPLFTCWKAVACFLARPFPHSHRRPLAARKEDGGEGEGGSCSLHKKDQDNKKQNQNYFQTRGTWALLIEQWASWVALSCSSQLGGVITSPGTAALTLMWTVLRHIWDCLETMKDKYQLIGKIWCHLMFKGCVGGNLGILGGTRACLMRGYAGICRSQGGDWSHLFLPVMCVGGRV